LRLKIEIDIAGLRSMQKVVGRLSDGAWKREAHRGVIDAGRRTETKVLKAEQQQLGLRTYGALRSRVRHASDDANLSYSITSAAGGQRIEEYRGLRALKSSGRALGATGLVSAAPWNAPRTFKRSFAANGGFFAMLPGGGSKKAPRMLWTPGVKVGQKRDDHGRFIISGSARTFGPIRRLFGASIKKELVRGETLETFNTVAPAMLVEKVVPRMEKLLRFK
jgi:hypothetical protein